MSDEADEVDLKIKYGNQVLEFYDIPVDIPNENLLGQILLDIFTPELKLPGGKMIKFNRPKYTLQKWIQKQNQSFDVVRGVLKVNEVDAVEVEKEEKELSLGVKFEEVEKQKKGLESALLELAHNSYWGLNGMRIDYFNPHLLYGEIVKSGGKLDGNALWTLGYMFQYGYGGEKDDKKSNEYFKKAAEIYSSRKVDDLKPTDWHNMGCMYLLGKGGFKQDKPRGISLLQKGVQSGNVLAMAQLGICYSRKGIIGSTRVSYSKAIDLFAKAAGKPARLAFALNELGLMYHHGHGVKKDRKKALEYFREAAEKGYRISIYIIGNFYYNGLGGGVDKDMKKAKEWYKRASDLGHVKAKRKLEELSSTL